MKILFLSSWFPYPVDNGSRIRIYNLLKGLSQHHEITLLSFHRRPLLPEHLAEVERLCQKVEVLPWKEFNPSSYRAITGFISIQPRSFIDTYARPMEQLIQQELCEGHGYSLIVASQIAMAAYAHLFGNVPALWDELELGSIYDTYEQASSARGKLRACLTWLKTSHYVARLLKKFGACTVASDQERKIADRVAQNYQAFSVIPNGVDLQTYRNICEEIEPQTLIFTGALTFWANYEALCFFLNEIYPDIKQAVPEVKVRVTGQNEGITLPTTYLSSGVEFTGYVQDIKPLIARHWLSIAPLRNGGGTRLKILEAMALGTPVVSTSKGVEGIEAVHGKHLLIADSPREFATMTIRLLQEPALRAELAENGKQLVSQKYDWQIIMPTYLKLVESLGTAS